MCGGALATKGACKGLGLSLFEERKGKLRAMREARLDFMQGGKPCGLLCEEGRASN